MKNFKVGVLTISDRVIGGIYEDLSGPEITACLKAYIKSDYITEYQAVSDTYSEIKRALIQLTDKSECQLVFTTGGTGPASRDITPEATESVCSRVLPGFGELMRIISLKYTPTAILSRQIAGIRGTSLIVNLPGKPAAIRQCIEAIYPAIPDCVKLISGLTLESNDKAIKIRH